MHANHDTHPTYTKLDAWVKFPDFQIRIRDMIVTCQAPDRIMISWSGIKAAVKKLQVGQGMRHDEKEKPAERCAVQVLAWAHSCHTHKKCLYLWFYQSNDIRISPNLIPEECGV